MNTLFASLYKAKMKLLVLFSYFVLTIIGNVDARLPDHYKTMESLLLYRMNFSADPCDDFYNYACGNYDDETLVITVENYRIMLNGLNALRNNRSNEYTRNSTAIQKALKYYLACVRVPETYDDDLRWKVNYFLDSYGLPFGFFLQDMPNYWFENNWVNVLKQVHDEFNVEPFFRTLNIPNELLTQLGKKPESESDSYLGLVTTSTFNENLYECKKESKENLTKKFMFAVLRIVKTMNLIATDKAIRTVATEMMELEFKLLGVNCEDENATIAEELDFYKLEELHKQDWPLEIEAYLTGLIETGAGNNHVDYKNLTIVVEKDLSTLLNDVFDSTPDYVLLRYMYFRIVQKAISDMPQPRTCEYHLSQLPLIKSRIYTESKYPSITERESVRSLALTIAKAVKNAVKQMITSVDWIKNDKKSLDGIVAKFNKLKTHIAIEDNLFDNTWLDAYYAQLNFNGVDSFYGLHSRLINFKMYEKIRKLFSKDKTVGFDTTIDNAGYVPWMNEFMINDGGLVAPNFNIEYPFSFNMGNIGSTIGHEITHAFDTHGINFDANGAYNSVLSDSGEEKMKKMSDCVIDFYDKIQLLPESYDVTHVNGTMTVGENIADIAGLDAAYRAFKKLERQFGGEKQLRHPQLRKLTHDQLFFLGFGSYYCTKSSNDEIYHDLKTDEHAPHKARVQGTVSNLPAFAKAFNCPAGARQAPEAHCNVWTE